MVSQSDVVLPSTHDLGLSQSSGGQPGFILVAYDDIIAWETCSRGRLIRYLKGRLATAAAGAALVQV